MRPFISSSVPAFAIALALSSPTLAQEAVRPSIGLRAAISEALQHSPQLLPADDAVASAGIQRRVAMAQYRPAITPTLNTGSAPAGLNQRSLGLSVSQLLPTGGQLQAVASSLSYGTGPGQLQDNGYTIGVSQPLLRGFGASAGTELKTADRALQNAERSAADARQQLVVSVTHAYFAAVRQQRLVEIGERAVERANRLVDMSEARVQVGLSTKLDALRARLLQSQARTSALRDQDAFETAVEDLNVLIGRSPRSPAIVEGDFEADMAALERLCGISANSAVQTADGLTEDALRDRLDVRIARAKVADARWNGSVAQWNLLPPMNLDISYTRRGVGASAADSAFGLLNGWRMGISSTYSLDHGRNAAAVAQAAITVRQAERAMSDAEQRAVMEVRRSSRALARVTDAVELQRKAVELALQQRELATFRYERGLADNLEVIDAENNVAQAEAALLSAEIDRALSFMTLQRASGTLEPNRFLQ
jgi:outer membrane protein